MHIGNTLYEMQQAHLYKESTNPANKIIENYHVDVHITPIAIPSDWNKDGLIENVKILRRELDLIIARIKELVMRVDQFAYHGKEFLNAAMVRTRESMNWYGMELARIRNTEIV